MSTTYTAWITTNDSLAGAEAGVSVSEADLTDGYRDERGFVAHSDTQDWPTWDDAVAGADALLESLGYKRHEDWVDSGGQCAAEVHKADV